jgi:hypothetical protein
LLAKGREWQQALIQRFPVEKHEEILSVLGLFILNRFREITYEEVIAMLKFDLMDTVAGRQLYEMGQQKGQLNTLQETVLDALDARFGLVPHKMIDQIHTIDQVDVLKNLHKEAIRCPNIGTFKERLSS